MRYISGRLFFVRMMLTCLCCFVAMAHASVPVPEETEVTATDQAEADRLSDDIRSLAERQVWTGVERMYVQATALGAILPADIHLTGAYAARERGDLIAVYRRLTRSAEIKPSQEVVDWLWDLDHNFGRVQLVADRKGTAVLEAKQMPLDPNRRQAVAEAIRQSKDSGSFKGLLPRGDYRFHGQDFRVEAGISVRVEVSPKVRRQGLNEPTIIYNELPTAVGQEKN